MVTLLSELQASDVDDDEPITKSKLPVLINIEELAVFWPWDPVSTIKDHVPRNFSAF
jgi:hypothetical protein